MCIVVSWEDKAILNEEKVVGMGSVGYKELFFSFVTDWGVRRGDGKAGAIMGYFACRGGVGDMVEEVD